MSRIKKINNNKSLMLNINDGKEYGLSDLNWEDSGGTFNEPKKIEDPSMNDFLKGYQMEPYEFKQYANKNVLHKVEAGETVNTIAKKYFGHESYYKQIISMNESLVGTKWQEGLMLIVGREPIMKTAAEEVRIIEYTPEGLAKEILTLWKQVDGPLQNFFDGFTANKTTNDMKKKICEVLKGWGYEVTPTLVDETPRHANAFKGLMKGANLKNAKESITYFKNMFPDSKVLQKVAKEIEELEEEGVKVAKEEARGLIDYYKLIFPDEYATSLVNISLDKPDMNFDEFKDIQISDEALEQMEKMDSGNQNPTSNKPNDGGVGGFDFTTQTTDGPGGVAPNMYETRASSTRLKKK